MQSNSNVRPSVAYLFETEQFSYTNPVRYTQLQSQDNLYSATSGSAGLNLTSDQKALLKILMQRFQGCPYVDLRELVMAFATFNTKDNSTPPKEYHDWQSNMLLEQFQFQPDCKLLDKSLTRELDQQRHESICANKLFEAVNNELLQERAFKENVRQCLDLYDRFERMTAQNIVTGTASDLKQYKKLNEQMKQIQTKYLQMRSYQGWLTKVIEELKSIGYIDSSAGRTNMQNIHVSLKTAQRRLDQLIRQTQQSRNNIRNKLSRLFQRPSKEQLNRIRIQSNLVCKQAYNTLSTIQSTFAQMEPELNQMYEQLLNAYIRYLKKLKDCEHIERLIELRQLYQARVLREQVNLTSHLKQQIYVFRTHHQLPVAYEQSEDFKEVIDNHNRTTYISPHYGHYLMDIQNALQFLNTKYGNPSNKAGDLFKQVCESKQPSSEAKSQISMQAEKFKNASQQNGYNIILLESLRRLEHLNRSNSSTR